MPTPIEISSKRWKLHADASMTKPCDGEMAVRCVSTWQILIPIMRLLRCCSNLMLSSGFCSRVLQCNLLITHPFLPSQGATTLITTTARRGGVCRDAVLSKVKHRQKLRSESFEKSPGISMGGRSASRQFVPPMAFSCAPVLRKAISGGNLGPMKRVCPKVTGLIATGCTAIGAVVGALSPSTGLLLAGRVIEGIGLD